jgi:V8-like Glu-specific endopeptidase
MAQGLLERGPMTPRTFSAALCLVTVLASCAPGTGPGGGESAESQGRPIVGGTPASDYPEAVLVDLMQGGQLVAYCSGTLIAPSVVLTAGHCVHGSDGWQITAPNAGGQTASSSQGETYDWNTASEDVDPSLHDLGLIFLSSPISLSSYPTLATSPLPDGSQVINIGRIDSGRLSTTDLYESQPLTVNGATSDGFPYDYIANAIIQPGDSGGPDMAAGSHTIVAVSSGAGGGTEVLARVDLLASWIRQQVASYGDADGFYDCI